MMEADMKASRTHVELTAIVVLVLGCGFDPGTAGQGLASGGSSGSGNGGTTLTGAGAASGVGLTNGGEGGAGGDIGITGSGGMSCGQTNVSVTPEPPDILIVQDKSLSMVQQPNGCCCGNASGTNCTGNDICTGNTSCGANSKWSEVSAAIDMVVMATQTSVNWGLVFFGSDNMCGVNMQPNVPIAVNNYTAISQAYANNQPSSYTPTEQAIDAAVAYMGGVKDTNPKYLLLATDGLPNCSPSGGNVVADNTPGTTTAVMNALAAGFPTFVVGIGNTMGTAALNMFATAGGEPQVNSADGNSFYEVNSTSDLVTALNKIVGLVASCTIPLTGVNGTLAKVAVSAKDASGNTIQIMQDPTNGWSYTNGSMTTIVLNGTACANLQNGSYSNFQFIYTCASGTICIDKLANGTCGATAP
jgi:hypothetical protein